MMHLLAATSMELSALLPNLAAVIARTAASAFATPIAVVAVAASAVAAAVESTGFALQLRACFHSARESCRKHAPNTHPREELKEEVVAPMMKSMTTKTTAGGELNPRSLVGSDETQASMEKVGVTGVTTVVAAVALAVGCCKIAILGGLTLAAAAVVMALGSSEMMMLLLTLIHLRMRLPIGRAHEPAQTSQTQERAEQGR